MPHFSYISSFADFRHAAAVMPSPALLIFTFDILMRLYLRAAMLMLHWDRLRRDTLLFYESLF